MNRYSTCVLSAMTIATLATNAQAQTAECEPFRDVYTTGGVPYEHITSETRRDFRISTTNLDQLGLDAEHVRRAIALGASIWNEQGGGRPLRYASNTTVTDIPQNASECTTPSTSTSIVVVDPGSDPFGEGAVARLSPRCVENISPDFALAKAFRVVLYALEGDGDPRPWVTAGNTIPAGNEDVVSSAIHEFGHSFNLTHHSSQDGGGASTQATVMSTSAGTPRGRDLYWRDFVCTRPLASSSTAYRRFISGGALGAEGSPPFLAGGLDDGWSKISAGMTFSNASTAVDWSSAAEGPGCLQWAKGQTPANARCLPSSNDFHVFTEAVLRDKSPTSSRVFYSTPDEYTNDAGTFDGVLANGDQAAAHQVHMRRSADGFVNSSVARQRECTQMTGFLQCTNAAGTVLAKPITSGHALAVAWLNGANRSVSAWVHQTRQDNADSHSVRIAVGAVGESTFPIADVLVDPSDGETVQSNVTPGVACQNNFSGSNDCIIAVVRQDDPSHRIRVYRFAVLQDVNRYVITVDPTVTVLPDADRTGNRITAFWHNSRFWLAWRSLGAGQRLQVRNSTDALSWVTVAAGATDTDAGPSAISYHTGNNQLLYTR